MDVGPPRTPPPPRRPQENTIKLHKNGQVATVLYTRVRTTVVFSKLTFKTELLVRDVCKISRLRNRIVILSRLLQCFLKVLQNRSEKLKNAFPRARIAILLGVFSDFQTSHTIFTIKLQTFGGLIFEVHFAR